MRKYYKFLTLFIIFSFCACFSGKPVEKPPRHLTSGIKEITRGTFWYNKGCYKRALKYFTKAHELFTVSDQIDNVAMSLNNIGNVYKTTGDIKSAILYYEEAFIIYLSTSNYVGAMQALSNRAAILIETDQLDEANAVLNQVKDISAEQDIVFIPHLTNRGFLYIKKKQYDDAGQVLNQALENVNSENLSELASVNFAYGKLQAATGAYENAIPFFRTALQADRKKGFNKGIATDLEALGDVYLNLDNGKDAVNYLKRSIKIYALQGDEAHVQKLMTKLEQAADSSGTDIKLTKHFVQKWLEGDTLEGPCD